MTQIYFYKGFFREGDSGNDWISGPKWPKFGEYLFAKCKDDVVVESVGPSVDWYHLDSPAIELALLADFSNIRDIESGRTFFENWGFPLDNLYGCEGTDSFCGGTYLEHILGAAGTVRLIRD